LPPQRIVCDEINDPAIVRLRIFVATEPNAPGLGSTDREARNTKEELVLGSINAILPAFVNAKFTVLAGRSIVPQLLIRRLRRPLSRKLEYISYVRDMENRRMDRGRTGGGVQE
jgi:hypothetical protein